MTGKIVRKPILTALLPLLIYGFCTNPLPALAAPTPTQLVEAISNSKVLPASVAVNARYNMGEVALYMYRGAVADNDLKIDSVLITKALKDKFGQDVKSVQLNFYDKNNKTQIRQVTVNQTHLESFASRQISQEQLLAFLTISRLNASGSSSSGSSSLLNVNVEAVLAMTAAPGYKVDERTIQLARIKAIARKSGNYQKLLPLYKKIDDLIRLGKTEEITPFYNELNPAIQLEESAASLRMEEMNNQAKLKAAETSIRAQLPAPPRFGICYRRRYALWVALSRMQLAGRDVVYPAVFYSQHVEAPFIAGDKATLQKGIMQLEQSLGIPVTQNWD